jgi:hypothetical protein
VPEEVENLVGLLLKDKKKRGGGERLDHEPVSFSTIAFSQKSNPP